MPLVVNLRDFEVECAAGDAGRWAASVDVSKANGEMKLKFLKSSPFGAISFLLPLGIIAVSVIVLSFSLSGVEDSSHDEHFAAAMLILAAFGAVALFAACGALVGFALSVVGLVRKGERRIFSVLGFVLNGVILVLGGLILFRNFDF